MKKKSMLSSNNHVGKVTLERTSGSGCHPLLVSQAICANEPTRLDIVWKWTFLVICHPTLLSLGWYNIWNTGVGGFAKKYVHRLWRAKTPSEGSPLCIRNYSLAGGWFCQKDVHTAQAVTHLRVTCGNAPRGGSVQVHCHLPLASLKHFHSAKKNLPLARRKFKKTTWPKKFCYWPGEIIFTRSKNSCHWQGDS